MSDRRIRKRNFELQDEDLDRGIHYPRYPAPVESPVEGEDRRTNSSRYPAAASNRVEGAACRSTDQRDPTHVSHQGGDVNRKFNPAPSVVPTTNSVNREYIILESEISPALATSFLVQARSLGFDSGIHHLSQLIFDTARLRILLRANAYEELWVRLFPNKPVTLIESWFEELTILEGANLIFGLFGPDEEEQKVQAAYLDNQLRHHEWGWNLHDPDEEDDIFVSILGLINSVELQPSPDRLRTMAKILIRRLPIENHVTTVFKQRTALLSAEERLKEYPITVLLRLKLILHEARVAVRAAAPYTRCCREECCGLTVRTNSTGKYIPLPVARTAHNQHSKRPKGVKRRRAHEYFRRNRRTNRKEASLCLDSSNYTIL